MERALVSKTSVGTWRVCQVVPQIQVLSRPRPSPRAPRTIAAANTESSPTANSGGITSAEAKETRYQPPEPLAVERPPSAGFDDVILLQAFGWQSSKEEDWYHVVKAEVPAMQEAGITHVWLPPPSKSVSPEGYMPTQLYDLDSQYGSLESLLALNTSLLSAGIHPVADIVINHRCADERDENGVWNIFKDLVPHPGRSIAWGPWAITDNDPDYHGRGGSDTGDDYPAAPDLDHSNSEVRAGLADWLRWLRDYIGFEGWRLDYARGYAPEEALWYIKETIRNPCCDFCVAECWFDAAWEGSSLKRNQDEMRQGLCDWIDATDGTIAVFDFTTKAILQEAVKHEEYDRLRDAGGKPPGLLGWWPQRAVTFIDNHDTGSSQKHWPFPSNGVMQGYAYTLTHPGIPSIFWEHWKNPDMIPTLRGLLDARRRAGIKADSEIEILAADPDFYVARIGGRMVCKLGARFDMGALLPNKDDGWSIVDSGESWAVWEKLES